MFKATGHRNVDVLNLLKHLEDSWTRVQLAILGLASLSRTVQLTLIALLGHVSQKGRPYPGACRPTIATLAFETRRSKATVHDALETLKFKKLIEWKSGRQNYASHYFFNRELVEVVTRESEPLLRPIPKPEKKKATRSRVRKTERSGFGKPNAEVNSAFGKLEPNPEDRREEKAIRHLNPPDKAGPGESSPRGDVPDPTRSGSEGTIVESNRAVPSAKYFKARHTSTCPVCLEPIRAEIDDYIKRVVREKEQPVHAPKCMRAPVRSLDGRPSYAEYEASLSEETREDLRKRGWLK